MKIVVIDGQGGKMGGLIVRKIKEQKIKAELYAIGTNSTATAAMLRSVVANSTAARSTRWELM